MKKNGYIILLVVAAAGVAGYFIWKKSKKGQARELAKQHEEFSENGLNGPTIPPEMAIYYV